MTVYVDDMHKRRLGRLGRMKMSLMIADTDEELHAFAARLGLRRAWFQGDHYDVSKARRAEALALGAVEVTLRQCAVMRTMKRRTGSLPKPEEIDATFARIASALSAFCRARDGVGP